MKKLSLLPGHHIGVDENGLGPRLGPLVVTGALAHVDEMGVRLLERKLPKKLRADLNDSKVLVSCHDSSLGEAWARALTTRTFGKAPKTPADLLRALLLEPETSLRRACPKSTENQCWTLKGEQFLATDEQIERVSGHLEDLAARGISVSEVRSEVVCTGRLNQLGTNGVHRFTADLHCMERLILHFREVAQDPIVATCGKVGGISKYEPFFGPLSGRLHTALDEGQAQSAYYFPTLGELRFVRDADAKNALVMLSSLVGKYVRELLMERISRFYRGGLRDPDMRPSGYHDPITAAFVEETKKHRKRLGIIDDCFERRRAVQRVAKTL